VVGSDDRVCLGISEIGTSSFKSIEKSLDLPGNVRITRQHSGEPCNEQRVVAQFHIVTLTHYALKRNHGRPRPVATRIGDALSAAARTMQPNLRGTVSGSPDRAVTAMCVTRAAPTGGGRGSRS
jgi:hypothetical protein